MKHAAIITVLFASCTAPCMDQDTLSELAQKSVRDQLKSPSTAVFSETKLTKTFDGTKEMIEGKVDAQNAFGAMMRSEYYVTFTCEGGKPAVSYGHMDGASWGPEWQAALDSINQASNDEAMEIYDRAVKEAEAEAAEAEAAASKLEEATMEVTKK